MNFKTLLLLISLLCIFGCGVKSAPHIPKGAAIPAYSSEFTDYAQGPEKSKGEE